tara:strand:+ start:359 stop:748 length:390 start_codon:yes stop_codon:yes gene_type:complete
MTKQKTVKTFRNWDEEQILSLVKLIVEHGVDTKTLTRKHNELHGTSRTEKAIDQQYRRMREIFTYVQYTEAWELMQQHRFLFLKPEPQPSKSEKRIADLESEVALLKSMLSSQQTPSGSYRWEPSEASA